MKISDKTYIIILLIAALALSSISYWRLREFNQSLSEINLPEIPSSENNLPGIDLEDFLPPEKEGYQEWISPDGKLKLRYPAGWTVIDKNLLESFDLTDISLAESEILFFAHQINIKEQASTALTISEFDAEKSLEEIIDKIEKEAEEQNKKVEITSIEGKEGVWLEITSGDSSQSNFYSKGKVIFAEDKTYLILLTAPQENWPQLEKIADEIFNSVELPSI